MMMGFVGFFGQDIRKTKFQHLKLLQFLFKCPVVSYLCHIGSNYAACAMSSKTGIHPYAILATVGHLIIPGLTHLVRNMYGQSCTHFHLANMLLVFNILYC